MRERTRQMVDALARLVSVESPSGDAVRLRECAAAVSDLCVKILGIRPEEREVDGAVHLLLRGGGDPKVLILGHFDTVWPAGTIWRWPFSVQGERATGPGIFDMKAGLVQGLYALAALDGLDGVVMLLTSDEETGSERSRTLIEDTARGCRAVLVLEPSEQGALKTARKGVSQYTIEIEGRAAHSGLAPEKGANALVELAHEILAIERIARPSAGTTVTPTVASAGSAVNTVPASASMDVDVRTASAEEQRRVDEEMRALRPTVAGTRLKVLGGPNRGALEPSASKELFARAGEIAQDLGIGPLEERHVGGASDGNFTAALGIPTLDGLGAVGEGAHAEGEHVLVSAMAERAALVAAMVSEIRAWR